MGAPFIQHPVGRVSTGAPPWYPVLCMGGHDFLVALTVVLGVAAVTTVLFQRLKQPVVLGYILAGFIVGPKFPLPLLRDRQIVQTLSELGVILLMFSLGLEFSLGKLLKLGPKAGIAALLQSSLMLWLGFVVGHLFGWTTLESLFTGAIVAISSTTIIAKVFDEQNIKGPLRELVVGILIVEDLIAILLMATLTAVVSGSGLSATEMAQTGGKLAFFLVALVSIGLLLVPRTVRAVNRLGRPETTLVASVGFCFAVSLLAQELGYSVALGAFIAGSLIAESGEEKPIEHLVQPVRDMFAAIFFVSVGVLIDPALIAEHWLAVLVLTLIVVVGKVLGVSLGAFLTGSNVRTSVRAGMSLAQIGEFSFIIAGLGLSLKATGHFLYPVAVAVSAITTLTTPWLIKASGPVANFIDRAMPRPLQTFVALYGSWVEQLSSSPREATLRAQVRRLARMLLIDLGLLAVVAFGASFGVERLSGLFERKFEISATVARVAIVVAAVALALPLSVGVVRVAHRLGVTIAQAALPAPAAGSVDLAAAPRHALIATLQLAVLLLAGLPLLAVTQPIFGGVYGAMFFGLSLAALGVAFWRGATNLHGHVRAGAETIVEAIVTQSRKGTPSMMPPDPLSQVHKVLPGIGEPVLFRLTKQSAAVGKSLAQLNLRGITGATVLVITRGGRGLLIPTPEEVLKVGDILALAGSHAAIDEAKALLAETKEPCPPNGKKA
jgi:monovalent cation:H+ antiporter-2, CPA2 family